MTLRLQFPTPPYNPRSVNDLPATVKAKIRMGKERQAWRDAAYWAALERRGVGAGHLAPATVRVSIPFRERRRRDPHNYTSTVVKWIVDGLVLAGMWPDDTPDHVAVADPELVIDPKRTCTVEIDFREVMS